MNKRLQALIIGIKDVAYGLKVVFTVLSERNVSSRHPPDVYNLNFGFVNYLNMMLSACLCQIDFFTIKEDRVVDDATLREIQFGKNDKTAMTCIDGPGRNALNIFIHVE